MVEARPIDRSNRNLLALVVVLLTLGSAAAWYLGRGGSDIELESSGRREVGVDGPKGPARSAGREAPPEGAELVRGRLVDAEGRSVGGVVVLRFEHAPGGDPAAERPRPFELDCPDGAFAFEQPGYWRLEIVARSPGAAPLRVVALKRPDELLDLGDLVCRSGAVVFGRVVDTSGRPVGGARVEVGVVHREIDPGASDVAFKSGLDRATSLETETGADGAFRLRGLPLSTTTSNGLLIATAPGYRPAARGGIDLAAGREQEVELTLQPARRLEIVVRAAPGGVPVAGARVEITALGHEASDLVLQDFVMQARLSDEEGRVVFDHLGPRGYRLRVAASGLVSPGERLLGTEESQVVIDLVRAGLVFGRLVDGATGAEIAEARLLARDAGSRRRPGRDLEILRADGAADFLGISSSPGLFALRDASSPDVAIEVEAEGFVRGVFEVPALLPDERREVRLELSPESRIEGRVLSHDGRPVVAALVRAELIAHEDWSEEVEAVLLGGDPMRLDPSGPRPPFGPSKVIETITDDAGDYVLRGLAAGHYRISAVHEMHRESLWRQVVFEETGVERGLELALQPGGGVSGVLLGPDGRSLPGLEVDLLLALPDSDGLFLGVEACLADGGGGFRFQGLLPGKYRLQADAGSRGGASLEVEIRADVMAEVLLRLTPGGR